MLKKEFEQEKEKINGLLEREDWTRKRFEETDEKINGLLEREDWTRSRFEGQDDKISDLDNKVAGLDEKIGGLLEREDWTRNRFEEHQQLIEKMQSRIQELARQSNNAGINLEIQEDFYNKKTYSQSGEDAILSYVLNFMGYDLTKITYLDLGANHAVSMSNTYTYYRNGCRGVLVEANPELIPDLQRERPGDIIVNKAIAFDSSQKTIDFYVMSGDGLSTISYEEAMHACEVNPDLYIKETYQVETITIKEIFETYFEHAPEILSIDLEGIETQILSEIDFETTRPLMIVLENIPYKPTLVIDEKENKAADILERHEYIEYAFTGINSIYLDCRAVKEFNRKLEEKRSVNG